jgi:hypothetical protein
MPNVLIHLDDEEAEFLVNLLEICAEGHNAMRDEAERSGQRELAGSIETSVARIDRLRQTVGNARKSAEAFAIAATLAQEKGRDAGLIAS